MTVIFWVPQKLNVASAGAALRRHVASRRLERGRDGSISAASSSEESTAGPEGRARRIHVSSPILGALEVDILEPYDADELAQVEFRGRPTAANLAVLESTMLAVARPRQQAGRSMDEMARIFGGEGEIGSLFPSLEEGLGPLFSPLRELLQELERAHAHGERGNPVTRTRKHSLSKEILLVV